MSKQEEKILARSVANLDQRSREQLTKIVQAYTTGLLVGLENVSALIKTPAGWTPVQIQYHALQRCITALASSAAKTLHRASPEIAGVYAAETMTMLEEAMNAAMEVTPSAEKRIFEA